MPSIVVYCPLVPFWTPSGAHEVYVSSFWYFVVYVWRPLDLLSISFWCPIVVLFVSLLYRCRIPLVAFGILV